MDYEQKYNKLVEAVKVLQETNPSDEGIQNWVNDNVPELAEPQGEKVRKWIYNYFRSCFPTWIHPDITCGEILNWLEKQGEHKRFRDSIQISDKVTRNEDGVLVNLSQLNRVAKKDEKQGEQKAINDTDDDIVEAVKDTSILDMVESKFKVGDIIKHNKANITCKVISVNSGSYYIENIETSGRVELFNAEQNFHLWTIQDAKDGDVLASNKSIFIFQKEYIGEKPTAYCGLMNGLFIEGKGACWTNEKCYPATKEQRDLLFQKMHEAGYTFDFKKKELKKLKFRVGDEVITENEESLTITRIDEEGYWSNDLFICDFDGEYIWDLVEQKPAEWSKEDDVMVNDILRCLPSKTRPEYNQRREDWLKSLKQKIGWKPSDEQMKALHDMNLTGNISYVGQGQALIELYNDLKKLKGE